MGEPGYEFDVHFDGAFEFQPLRYTHDIVLNLFTPILGYDRLLSWLEERCGQPFNNLYFLLPENQLDGGLIKIDGQEEVDTLFDLGYSYGKLHIYLDHFMDDLTQHLVVPPKPNEGDVSDEGNSIRVEDYLISQSQPPKTQPSQPHANLGEPSQPNEIAEDATHVVSSGSSSNTAESTNKSEGEEVTGGEPKVDGEPKVGDDEYSTSDEEYEPNESSDSDSDDALSVDYLSEGEDELREFRLMRAAAKKNPNPNRQPKLGGNTNAEIPEVVAEHEEFMQELVQKLKGADDEDQDVFKKIETLDKWPVHNHTINWRQKKPIVGERYINHQQFREMMTFYAIANGFNIWFEKSTQLKCVARCGQRPPQPLKEPELGKQRKQHRYPAAKRGEEPKCPWRCYAQKMKSEDSFQITSLKDEHTCVRNFRFGSLVNYKWIGKVFGDRIRANPDIKLVNISDMVMKKYKCMVTPNQARKAKTYALHEYEKSMEEHYAMLRSYAQELLESNPGSTVKLGVTRDPDEKVYFDRMYVCFDALKKGWLHGCRKVIALDGCFLKKPNQGELLSAIGRDGNNHIYPIAWAVVGVENKDNWSWFLELLAEDLDLGAGSGITLISDQHKGLIQAVKDVLPNAEHRQCARHIYDNFRKYYTGAYLQGLFWAASKASYPQLFDRIMKKIRDANPAAHQFLVDKDPKTWSRAFFVLHRGCESVENGFSECFNYVIALVRHKPIITMLEAIRTIVLERMNTLRRLCETWTTDICPSIMKRIEWCKDQHRYWKPYHCGMDEWEVRQADEGFKVNEARRTCSCRLWELTGLPCPHAVAVILKMSKNVEYYVPVWFMKTLYQETYGHHMHAVGGITTWKPTPYNNPLPPKHRVMPGRPKKKRIRAQHESHVIQKGSKTWVTKHGVTMTCQRCLQPGHNKKGCKNDPVERPPKEKKKMGRPPKNGGQTSQPQSQGGPRQSQGGTRETHHDGPSQGGARETQHDGPSESQHGVPTEWEDAGPSQGGPSQGGPSQGGPSEGGLTPPDGHLKKKQKLGDTGTAPNVQHRWTKKTVYVDKVLSPKKKNHDDNFVIGSCSAATKAGVAIGVSSVGFRNPKFLGVKGPRKHPSWWGTGICVDPNNGEQYIGGGDGIPVPIWPKDVPIPSASELLKQKQGLTNENQDKSPERTPKRKTIDTEEGTSTRNTTATPTRTPRRKSTATPERRSARLVDVKKRVPSQRVVLQRLGKKIGGKGATPEDPILMP